MNRCATGGASGWKGRGLWVLGVLLASALVVAGRAQGLVNEGDLVVITAGAAAGSTPGATNLITVRRVEPVPTP